MVGQRFRLKNGDVVTVKGINAGSILAILPNGATRYFNREDICHMLGQPCERDKCPDNPKKTSSEEQK